MLELSRRALMRAVMKDEGKERTAQGGWPDMSWAATRPMAAAARIAKNFILNFPGDDLMMVTESIDGLYICNVYVRKLYWQADDSEGQELYRKERKEKEKEGR